MILYLSHVFQITCCLGALNAFLIEALRLRAEFQVEQIFFFVIHCPKIYNVIFLVLGKQARSLAVIHQGQRGGVIVDQLSSGLVYQPPRIHTGFTALLDTDSAVERCDMPDDDLL